MISGDQTLKKGPYSLTTQNSGLRILTIPMPNRETIAISVWVKVGSRYESLSQAGISHCLEHMVFKGTKKRSGREIRRSIEGVGGMLNAFTGEESTCFFVKVLPRHLRLSLDVLSDMVFGAILSADELEKEKAVIIEEIKMYRDVPSHHVHDLMSDLLWPDHPLGRSISGTEESVARLQRKNLADFKDSFYGPSNIVVAVAGAVIHEEIVDIISDYFESRSRVLSPVLDKPSSLQKKPAIRTLTRPTEQTHFVIGFRTVSRFHPDRYKLALLNVLLGANMSSRLFEIVREKKALAYEIRSGAGFYHDTGYLSITAGVENSKTLEAIRVILDELVKLTKQRVLAGELSRGKDFFLSQLVMALEDTLDHMLWVSERVVDSRGLPERDKIEKSIREVTEDDLLSTAQRFFTNANLNLALISPKADQIEKSLQEQFYLKAKL